MNKSLWVQESWTHKNMSQTLPSMSLPIRHLHLGNQESDALAKIHTLASEPSVGTTVGCTGRVGVANKQGCL